MLLGEEGWQGHTYKISPLSGAVGSWVQCCGESRGGRDTHIHYQGAVLLGEEAGVTTTSPWHCKGMILLGEGSRGDNHLSTIRTCFCWEWAAGVTIVFQL